MQRTFETLAAIHNCSPETIQDEIEKALLAGRKCTDPSVTKKWSEIPRSGEAPTAEEIIAYCAREALRRIGTR